VSDAREEPTEFLFLTFLAAVQEGIEDQEAGRVVSDEELGRRLDERFGALPTKK
jgi:hypothetical protein